MKTVHITYEDFLLIKQAGYSMYAIKMIACKYLGISSDEIEDIDWNYTRTFNVYLKSTEVEYNDDLEY